MKTVHFLVSGALIAGILLSAGCVKLWQDNLDIKTYMLEADRTATPLEAALADKLWIDHVTVLAPFNMRNMVLRNSDVEYSTSYYTELLIPPAENVRNVFFSWLSDSGIFNSVSLSDREGISHRLVVTVKELYGDTATSEAVLGIQVSLLDEKKREMRVLLSREYHRRAGLTEVKAEELIRAYNVALTQILAECEQDIIAALK